MAKKGLKLDFTDVREFEKKVRDQARTSGSRLEKGTLKATLLVRNEAVKNTRAGVLYADGVYERGNLRRSLSFDLISPTKGKVFISKGLKYPTFVEKGTRKMRAKPFLEPALEGSRQKIKEIYAKIIAQGFKKMKL